jgi:hypothetical protein
MPSRAQQLEFARQIATAAEKSPYIWAVSYIALPKGATWDFSDRKWQVDIIEDLHPKIIVEKPTQIGLTTVSTTKALWFVSNYKSRAMYTLPRRDDVTDYTATTLDPMIESSDYLTGRIGKTNTARLKRIGDSYYHVMEASVTPRMLPVDILINDEVDMSDQDNIEQFMARLDASKYQYHYQFSTPTVSGFGIDAAYERSDRREWVVRCSRCNTDQTLDWEEHLVKPDGESPYLACTGCREKLRSDDIVSGHWEITNPGALAHGYHVSHLMLPYTRPVELLVQEEEVMDQKTFYNLRLGRPWKPIGGSMPLSMFRDNAFRSGHSMQTHRQDGYRYYLGADQGNEIHVVVGRVPDGDDRLEIVYAEHIQPRTGEDQFERLGAIMRMFDIDFAVCDANPNRQSVYNLAQSLHGKLGAADIGAYTYPFKWYGFQGDSAYKLVCNRTDMLDGLRDDFSTGKISFWGTWDRRTPIIKQIIKHCGNLKRDTTSRKLQSGGETIVGVWRRVGEDHFAFSLSLLRLAAIIAPNKSKFDFAVVGEQPISGDNGSSKVVKSRVWKDTYYNVEEEDKEAITSTRFR